MGPMLRATGADTSAVAGQALLLYSGTLISSSLGYEGGPALSHPRPDAPPPGPTSVPSLFSKRSPNQTGGLTVLQIYLEGSHTFTFELSSAPFLAPNPALLLRRVSNTLSPSVPLCLGVLSDLLMALQFLLWIHIEYLLSPFHPTP